MGAVLSRRDDVLGVLNFLGLWLRRPRSIGAIAPSSKQLAMAIADEVDFTRPGIVVELGGGTGAITRALIAHAAKPENIVVVEREAALCALLSARFPGVRVIHGDASELQLLLAAAGIGQVKAIVSGLPLRSIPSECHDAVIREAFSVLSASGVFVQFTYGLAAPVRHALAGRDGLIGRRSRWVLGNLPPAALWRYRRRSAPVAAPTADTRPIIVTPPPAGPSPETGRIVEPSPLIATSQAEAPHP